MLLHYGMVSNNYMANGQIIDMGCHDIELWPKGTSQLKQTCLNKAWPFDGYEVVLSYLTKNHFLYSASMILTKSSDYPSVSDKMLRVWLCTHSRLLADQLQGKNGSLLQFCN